MYKNDAKWSERVFREIVAPYLERKLGWQFIFGESGSGAVGVAIDRDAGVDGIVKIKGVSYGYAQRCQRFDDYQTVTIRAKRLTTGVATQFEKDSKAMDAGGLMAHIGVHAYIPDDKEVQAVYIYSPKQITRLIQQQTTIPTWERGNPKPKAIVCKRHTDDGNIVAFFTIDVERAREAGLKIDRYSESSDRLTALINSSGVWDGFKPPEQNNLFPGVAAMP